MSMARRRRQRGSGQGLMGEQEHAHGFSPITKLMDEKPQVHAVAGFRV